MTSKRCKDWCDTFASAYPVKSYCSDECKAAGRSINEKDKPEAGRTCICDDEVPPRPSTCIMPAVSGKSYCERCLRRDCEHHWNPAPRPVERCSCEESVALRKALVEIDKRIGGFIGHPGTTVRDIHDIARRALALGGEET
jgi:hypothetical protein